MGTDRGENYLVVAIRKIRNSRTWVVFVPGTWIEMGHEVGSLGTVAGVRGTMAVG
jgi:hypothetical protein